MFLQRLYTVTPETGFCLVNAQHALLWRCVSTQALEKRQAQETCAGKHNIKTPKALNILYSDSETRPASSKTGTGVLFPGDEVC
jgi:hypothetical protein